MRRECRRKQETSRRFRGPLRVGEFGNGIRIDQRQAELIPDLHQADAEDHPVVAIFAGFLDQRFEYGFSAARPESLLDQIESGGFGQKLCRVAVHFAPRYSPISSVPDILSPSSFPAKR